MKIKRYVAATMREVLAQVRAEQGPDAVIIANRRAEGGGVELITAVDYDDALMDEAGRALGGVPAEAVPALSGPAPGPEDAPATYRPDGTAPASAEPPRMAWSQDPALVAMRREVESLRELLEQQMAAMSWAERLRTDPAQARVLTELSRLGVAPDAARLLIANLPSVARDAEPARLAMALLMKHVAVTEEADLARDRLVTIVGATGVGKTTTLIKIATRHARTHGPKSVGFVTLAEDRLGGRDELMAFCRLLEAPLLRVASPRGFATALEQLRERSLVLVDTPGTGARDPRRQERLDMLAACGGGGRLLLALPANGDQAALDELTRTLLPLRPQAALLTKIDEAAGLGGALSVLVRHALPAAYLATGQDVVEDLHSAASRRVWLIKQAYALANRNSPIVPIDDDYMAEHFGRQVKHA